MVPYESDLYRQPHDYYQYLNSDGESHGGKSKNTSLEHKVSWVTTENRFRTYKKITNLLLWSIIYRSTFSNQEQKNILLVIWYYYIICSNPATATWFLWKSILKSTLWGKEFPEKWDLMISILHYLDCIFIFFCRSKAFGLLLNFLRIWICNTVLLFLCSHV